MEKRKNAPAVKHGNQEKTGGREFGNVIEPTQGQMASGNKGLTADFGKPEAKKPVAKKGGR